MYVITCCEEFLSFLNYSFKQYCMYICFYNIYKIGHQTVAYMQRSAFAAGKNLEM